MPIFWYFISCVYLGLDRRIRQKTKKIRKKVLIMSNGIHAAISSRPKELGRRCEDGGSMWDTIKGSTAHLRKLCHHVNRRVLREQLMKQVAEIAEDGFDQTEGLGSFQKVVINFERPVRVFVCGPVQPAVKKTRRQRYTREEMKGSHVFHQTFRRHN